MRYLLALGVLALGVLAACARREAPVRQPDADSARAVSVERNVAGAPPAEAPDTRPLKRAIHDLAVAISNVRTHPNDTAYAPGWTAKLDSVAAEMPEPSDAYAASYQHTKDAILLARELRLSEAYAYVDTAFRLLH